MHDGAQQVQVVRELVNEESIEVNEARAAIDTQNGIGITERALPQRKRILVEVQLCLRIPLVSLWSVAEWRRGTYGRYEAFAHERDDKSCQRGRVLLGRLDELRDCAQQASLEQPVFRCSGP